MQHKVKLMGFIMVVPLFMWICSYGAAQADDKTVDPSAQESEIFVGETGKPNEPK